MDQEYYKLIEDYHNKTIGNAGLMLLMDWVGENEQHQQIFREALQAFEAAEFYLSKPQQQQQHWLAIQQHLQQETMHHKTPKMQLKWNHWLSVAALLAITLGLTLGFFPFKNFRQTPEVVFNEIYNPKGQKRLVTLPDGSNVYLNGDTRIRYAPHFNSGKRIIYLEGEAFFDVQHREKQPFIVHTGAVSTSVLGTSFNINAYGNQPEIAITVQSGKVGVVLKNKKQQVHYLIKDEQLHIRKSDGRTVQEQVHAADANSWIAYKLIFHNTPMAEIADVIGRAYDLDIEFRNPALKKVKLTAKFDKCSARQVMDQIAELSHSTYTIYENKIIIH